MTLSVILVLVFLYIVTITLSKLMEKTIKDWEYLDILKKRSNNVSSKEEIEALYKDLIEFASKVNNKRINNELIKIDNFITNSYKKLK